MSAMTGAGVRPDSETPSMTSRVPVVLVRRLQLTRLALHHPFEMSAEAGKREADHEVDHPDGQVDQVMRPDRSTLVMICPGAHQLDEADHARHERGVLARAAP